MVACVLRRLASFGVAGLGLAFASTLQCNRHPQTAAAARGAAVYAKTCSVCHGPAGQGYAADEAPALANPSFLSSVSDDYLERAILNGRRGTTMSAWSTARGGPLTPSDVDDLVALFRSWGPPTRTTLDERPLAGDVPRGALVFDRECIGCHGAEATGGPYLHIGGAEVLDSATNGFLRAAIGEGRPGTRMPGFAAKLGPGGIDDVLARLRDFREHAAPDAGAERAARQTPKPPMPLGPVPLNRKGPEPVGFRVTPATTPADVIKRELDRGAKLGILDARAPSDYVTEHIAGAVSVPFYDPSPYLSALPKDAWLVCYCACPHAESGALAEKLRDKGFSKVTVLDEGLGVWKSRKYPTTAGNDP